MTMPNPNLSNETTSVRDRIERGFEWWAASIIRRPWRVIAVCLALSAALISQLPHLEMDVSDEGFLHPEDPIRIAYDANTRHFGGDEAVVLGFEPPEIFEAGFIDWLRALHEDLEEVTQIEQVTSLINARNTYGRADELVVEDLFETTPTNVDEFAQKRARVFDNPLYLDNLISRDGRATLMVVRPDRYSSLSPVGDALEGFDGEPGGRAIGDEDFLTETESIAIAAEVLDVIARHTHEDFETFITGGPVFDYWILQQMQHDILKSIVASSSFIALLLVGLFRRLSGVLLPIGIVMLALLCATATMAISGVPVTLPIQVLPSFLLAVGVCGAVHLLVAVYRSVDEGLPKPDAIVAAMGHAGLPVLMAGLTTAGGLASFAASPLAPVAHFGVFGPIGVLFTLFFVLVLLPALLVVTPISPRGRRESGEGRQPVDRIMLAFGRIATRHPLKVTGVFAALLVVAAIGTTRLGFSHHPLDWLPPGTMVQRGSDFLNDHMGNMSELRVLLETPGVENGFQDPEVLARMDDLRSRALALDVNGIQAANSASIADIVKETHRALNENRADHYLIPIDPLLVAQELLLFENSGTDDLEDFVDSRFSMASFRLQIPWVDAIEAVPFIDAFERTAQEAMGNAVQMTLTGGTVIFTRIFAAVIQSMAQSYALALLIVTPLMILLIGTLRGGLVSMAPNLAPILLTLGWMGWTGYSLDFSTMMIGAIVLGVAVDDTIHFMHVFQRNYRAFGDAAQAVEETLRTTGRAILFTSIVLCVGFSGFMLATMRNLVATGALTCFAIVMAFLADVLLAPALMVLLLPNAADRGAGVPAKSSHDDA